MVSNASDQSSDSPDTSALLRSAGAGDQLATERLLDRHRNQLKQMVAVRMHPGLTARIDPSDVVQEALIVAAKRLPQYLQQQPIAFYPWLRQLAFERLIELHRYHLEREKRSVLREVPIELALPDRSASQLVDRIVDLSLGPRSRAVREELRQRVRAALEDLPSTYREVLVLRHLEQLSVDDTAEVLGIAPATVKTRYYRAISRLHRVLHGTMDDS